MLMTNDRANHGIRPEQETQFYPNPHFQHKAVQAPVAAVLGLH